MAGTRASARRALAATAVLGLVAGGMLVAGQASPPEAPMVHGPRPQPQVEDVQRDGVRSGLLKAPLAFVPNTGALDERVAFSLPGASATVYLTAAGLTYRLAAPAEGPAWVVRQDFEGAAEVRPVAAEASPTTVSYFKGAREQWKTGVPTAATVAYRGLWPGVDVAYGGTGERLKYSFTVAAGADPAAIRLAYRGAGSVTLTPEGALAVETPAGGFTDDAPTAHQDVNGRRVPVAVSYALAEPEPDGSRPYGFALGPYDPARPLVVDPATIVYAGFIGGSFPEDGGGIAVDGAGAAYVTGVASGGTFPVAVGPDLTANGGVGGDAFVAKVAPGGAGLVYAGFIGGSGTDSGNGIAVDGAGAAYVTGETQSTEATFPVAVGPDLTANGNGDAFVAKVAPGGADLVYAGFIGGSNTDFGNGIAVDGAGAAYVTGDTLSTETTFPVAVGPDLTANGNGDAFVAKVAPGGAGLAYAGFIGGDGGDSGKGIAVDAAGAAYVAGDTSSTETTFPVAVGPDLTANGGTDAFVAKVASGGAGLAYAGFIGGSNHDLGNAIAVDGAGAAYVTGETKSTEATFPIAGGPDLTANGGTDAFVAKVPPGGAGLAYAGFIGGSATDQGFGIAVDAAGAAYVAGDTSSTETTFPVAVGPDLTANGNGDAFVAKVAPGGAGLVYAGFIGGSSSDFAVGVAVDGAGAAYVTGQTLSTEATFPVAVGPDLTANGFADDYVVKVAGPLPSLPAVFRSTTWILGDRLDNGAGTFALTQGTRPLVPIFGDWDGNGSETPATYEGGSLKLRNDYLGGAATTTIPTGFDTRGFPVAGDFNGDGTDDLAVFRAGTWQVRLSTGATTSFSFSSGTWPSTVPVAGDWDGDGTDGIGVYDLATGLWSLRPTATPGGPDPGVFVFWAGPGTGSYPVVGDWDADGDDTVGVKAGIAWSLNNANDTGPTDLGFTFGLANDLALAWR